MNGAVIGIALALIAVLAIAVLVPMGRAFSRELKYVEMKILNSRHEKELAYWERRKKSLWMSLLPFRYYDPHSHHRSDDHSTEE